uniref:DUF4283 domain-containing protein n=1 Tax=Quercus lobata TaxID=97700 RepID=A0A7N2M535_QUELO
MQHYTDDAPAKDLAFNKVLFWVQVHDIPISFQTRKVAEKLCETVGEIQRSNGATDDDRGNFFWVRVMVDVTSPLCRGWVITLPNGNKHWIKFRDVIYVPGYYEEKSSKAREKKAELAAHMATRAASVAPPLGLAVSKREVEEMGENINSSLLELNVRVNKEGGYVAEDFQLGDNHCPSFKADLMPHYNSAFASNSVLDTNSYSSSSNRELLNKENGNPIITEIKDGESHFNANSNPSSIDQRLASIREKTVAASSHGVMPHSLDDQGVNQSPQSTVGILGQKHSLRTWKRVLRQCSLGVLENKSELEKKRKSSFNLVVGSNPPNKRLQVPLKSDDTISIMVEAAMQPCQEP